MYAHKFDNLDKIDSSLKTTTYQISPKKKEIIYYLPRKF